MALKFIYITNYDQLTQGEIDSLEAQASSDANSVHKFAVSNISGKEGHAFIEMDDSNAPDGASFYSESEIRNIIKGSDWSENEVLSSADKRKLRKKFAEDLLDEIAVDNEAEMSGADYQAMLADADFATINVFLAPHASMIMSAYLAISAWSTKSWISDERRDGYKAKMQTFLESIGDL